MPADAILTPVSYQNEEFSRMHLAVVTGGLMMKAEDELPVAEAQKWKELFWDYAILPVATPQRLDQLSYKAIDSIKNPGLLELFLAGNNTDQVISRALQNPAIGEERLTSMFTEHEGNPKLMFGVAMNPLIYSDSLKWMQARIKAKHNILIDSYLCANKAFIGQIPSRLIHELIRYQQKEVENRGFNEKHAKIVGLILDNENISVENALIFFKANVLRSNSWNVGAFFSKLPASFIDRLSPSQLAEFGEFISSQEFGYWDLILNPNLKLNHLKRLSAVVNNYQELSRHLIGILESEDPDLTGLSQIELKALANLTESPALLKKVAERVAVQPDTEILFSCISNRHFNEEDLIQLINQSDARSLETILNAFRNYSRLISLNSTVIFALQSAIKKHNLDIKACFKNNPPFCFNHFPEPFDSIALEWYMSKGPLNRQDRKTIAANITLYDHSFEQSLNEDDVFDIFYPRVVTGEVSPYVQSPQVFTPELLTDH